jgi:hypothetical protein
LSSGLIAAVRADAQLGQISAPGQQVGQLPGLNLVAGIDSSAQLVQLLEGCQHVGQLHSGLNYIYNVVPRTHPDGAWIRNWLALHGLREASRGQLRRQMVSGVTGPAGPGSR